MTKQEQIDVLLTGKEEQIAFLDQVIKDKIDRQRQASRLQGYSLPDHSDTDEVLRLTAKKQALENEVLQASKGPIWQLETEAHRQKCTEGDYYWLAKCVWKDPTGLVTDDRLVVVPVNWAKAPEGSGYSGWFLNHYHVSIEDQGYRIIALADPERIAAL